MRQPSKQRPDQPQIAQISGAAIPHRPYDEKRRPSRDRQPSTNLKKIRAVEPCRECHSPDAIKKTHNDEFKCLLREIHVDMADKIKGMKLYHFRSLEHLQKGQVDVKSMRDLPQHLRAAGRASGDMDNFIGRILLYRFAYSLTREALSNGSTSRMSTGADETSPPVPGGAASERSP